MQTRASARVLREFTEGQRPSDAGGRQGRSDGRGAGSEIEQHRGLDQKRALQAACAPVCHGLSSGRPAHSLGELVRKGDSTDSLVFIGEEGGAEGVGVVLLERCESESHLKKGGEGRKGGGGGGRGRTERTQSAVAIVAAAVAAA